jgi:hypothetical protein
LSVLIALRYKDTDMKKIELHSWTQFAWEITQIRQSRVELATLHKRSFDIPLFRGLGCSDWGLKTTLERAYPLELSGVISDLPTYYRYISRSKSSVETLTDVDWGALPDPPDFEKTLAEFETLGAQFFLIKSGPLYRYLIYLRHHGFPSPLLDWTASPYVAAFFAFDSMTKNAKSVVIYAMLRDSMRVSSSDVPTVDLMGPYIRTHRRHLIQQSQYSICMVWHQEFQFASHDDALAAKGTLGLQGELIRITIPAEERTSALADLDQMNINAFSLFGSEDSLVRTVARRDGLLLGRR